MEIQKVSILGREGLASTSVRRPPSKFERGANRTEPSAAARSSTHSAFTAIELLFVVSIIVLLAALLFPVFERARESAYKTMCASNLHQSWLAVELYRQDNDGSGKYGTDYEMGLPPKLGGYDGKGGKTPQELLGITSLHCVHFPSPLSIDTFSYEFRYQDPNQQSNGQNRWDRYVMNFQDNAILVTDSNHNSPNIPLESDEFPKFGMGVILSGSLIKVNKPGDTDILTWWTTPCTTSCGL